MFLGHEGGASVVVAFEERSSGTLTFTLDKSDRINAVSAWFKQGFAKRNVAGQKPIFELRR